MEKVERISMQAGQASKIKLAGYSSFIRRYKLVIVVSIVSVILLGIYISFMAHFIQILKALN